MDPMVNPKFNNQKNLRRDKLTHRDEFHPPHPLRLYESTTVRPYAPWCRTVEDLIPPMEVEKFSHEDGFVRNDLDGFQWWICG